MAYSGHNVEMMRRTWLKRKEKKEIEEQKRKEKALNKARETALFLKKNYSIESVYLFGSLAWRTKYTAHSDIDLYVKGFPENKSYWDALAKSQRIAMPFPLNIVLEENARPGMKEKIEKEGILL